MKPLFISKRDLVNFMVYILYFELKKEAGYPLKCLSFEKSQSS